MKETEKHRNSRLQHDYGINSAQYSEMLANQFGVCKICGSESKLHIDHSHRTGEVRGLLCGRCNMYLGWFEKYESMIVRYVWK